MVVKKINFNREKIEEILRKKIGIKNPTEIVSDHFKNGILKNIDDPYFSVTGTDPVKKPSHYQGRYGMEAIDVIKNFSAAPEYEEGFYWGNAVKYMLRWHAKNGLQDLKKARQNLDWLIQTLEETVDE